MSEKLLLDVDPGIDDALAILMALGNDDVDVVGLTTVMGNTTVENTTRNALALLEFVDRTDVPVARGAGRPFADELVMAEYVHGPGGVPETVREALPEPSTDPVDRHAVDFILDQADEHGDELTIAAVGPQTNLALALAKDPSLPDRIGGIYQMGGALKTTGNVTPQASFNFYVDAAAAARVVQDGWPTVVGLDVTEPAYLPPAAQERFRGHGAYGDVVADILEYKAQGPDGTVAEGGSITSDAVVLAGILGDPITYEEAYVEIDTTGGPSNGATVYDEHGVYEKPPNCTVALDVDVERCRELILSNLETLLPGEL
ncbi:Inosine-uridine nucleoside N-ribohydrolase [Halogranum amylolyticum]|uniref:Inosine-uridine nucleoside N-ribohydrolase n=1 Tax=Halogranum amylolyticum TaxID=660520 RepID=A0A1H8MTF9_9EURY|nr:nucleoside hydrolase [Halogranum amylolyticum]SEO20771.1 Inosine-uridine nucleoside N-ribohydrolase [Halogranum amylolyticum]